ncbi:hypothetical protein H2248_011859 [Termitomyces sp. 'cryptogamus']|nr:hypothetical protein H2248_011859 [Termitomyces sp. 'cryptogamus']
MIVTAGLPSGMAALPAGSIFTTTYIGTSGKSQSLWREKHTLSLHRLRHLCLSPQPTPLILTQIQKISQALDKRMSMISDDWISMSATGAQAAIRSSMPINCDSAAFLFGNIRLSMDKRCGCATENENEAGKDGYGPWTEEPRCGSSHLR